MIRRLLLFILLLPLYAAAQSGSTGGTVRSTGTIAANDCVKFVSKNVITTAGAACGTGSGSGTVTSVLGTANQITSDGSTTTPTLTIPSTFIAPGSIAATTTVSAAAGSAAAAGLSVREAGTGLYSSASGILLADVNGTPSLEFTLSSAQPQVFSAALSWIGFASATLPGTCDTGFSRDSAGVIDVGNCVTNGSKTGTLKALALNLADTAANTDLTMKNTTAAVVGTSQGSPILALCGRAFHGSADVEDCMTLKDLPGNGNDAVVAFTIGHTGTSTGVVQTLFTSGNVTNPGVAFTTQPGTGIWETGGDLRISRQGTDMLDFASTGPAIRPTIPLAFYDGAFALNVALSHDSSISGLLDVGGNTTAGNSTGKLKAAGYISGGTKFTTDTGCGTPTSLVGGATAGTFVANATSCTVVITMGDTATAPTGWACTVSDRTTGNLFRQTASSATTATVSGTAISSDVISFSCTGY